MKRRSTQPGLSRRSLLLSGLALPLTGCAAPYGLNMKTFGEAAGVSLGLKDPPAITLEQASKIPYASISFQIGNAAPRAIVLATDGPEGQIWTSSERQAIVTSGGRIVKTAGLKWNLSKMHFPNGDPLPTLLQTGIPEAGIPRSVDFSDIHRYGVTIRGHFMKVGLETITTLGTKLHLLKIAERCKSDDIDWNFVNYFWIDPDTGFVWRSEQSIHPNLPRITLNVLRPAG